MKKIIICLLLFAFVGGSGYAMETMTAPTEAFQKKYKHKHKHLRPHHPLPPRRHPARPNLRLPPHPPLPPRPPLPPHP